MSPGRADEVRFEIILLGFFSVTWTLAIVVMLGLVPVAGLLRLDLYTFYAIASLLGWVAGNVYVARRRAVPAGSFRRRVLLSYLVGPPSLLYILRALAPQAVQHAAPLVPLYSFVVYALFFLVPVTLRKTFTDPRGE